MNTRSIHRTLAVLALCGATQAAGAAETPLERGRYLMQSIVACGNCHTPQGLNGPVAGMELAGGLRPHRRAGGQGGRRGQQRQAGLRALPGRAAGPLRRMPFRTRRSGRA